MRIKNKTQKGSTVAELLVVIAIVVILSVIVVVALNSARVRARDANRESDIANISKTLELYKDKKGTFPKHNCAGNVMDNPNATASTCHETFNSMIASLREEDLLEDDSYIDPKDPTENNYSGDIVPQSEDHFWYGYDVGNNGSTYELSYWSETAKPEMRQTFPNTQR